MSTATIAVNTRRICRARRVLPAPKGLNGELIVGQRRVVDDGVDGEHGAALARDVFYLEGPGGPHVLNVLHVPVFEPAHQLVSIEVLDLGVGVIALTDPIDRSRVL